MNEVTFEEAKKIVSDNKYAVIFFTRNSCDVCTQFHADVITKVPEICTKWKFATVLIDNIEGEDRYFVTNSTPSSFIFMNGQRLRVGDGYATLEVVTKLLSEFDGTAPLQE
jgi:hypothetical protein